MDMFLLLRCIFLSLLIALVFARYYMHAGKRWGRAATLYRGIGPGAPAIPTDTVFSMWPSHQSCICLILTSALCRKRRLTGWSKQHKLMLLEGTWVCAGFEDGSVSIGAPPALLWMGQQDPRSSQLEKQPKMTKPIAIFLVFYSRSFREKPSICYCLDTSSVH